LWEGEERSSLELSADQHNKYKNKERIVKVAEGNLKGKGEGG